MQISRITLHEHVRIQEGIGARIATGDELVLLFSPESRDLLPRVAAAQGVPGGSLMRRFSTTVIRWRLTE